MIGVPSIGETHLEGADPVLGSLDEVLETGRAGQSPLRPCRRGRRLRRRHDKAAVAA
jgi:hypothetical protein